MSSKPEMTEEEEEFLDAYFKLPKQVRIEEQSVPEDTGIPKRSIKDFASKLEIFDKEKDFYDH